uniref:Cadherin 8 n=1 Tax=Callorhinchus milii TaxID=7868 RepID=A0A4W3GGU5_CALMI
MAGRPGKKLPDVRTGLVAVWIGLVASVQAVVPSPPLGQPSPAVLMLDGVARESPVLSRSKRGWVWNQMFVLEEFSGPEPILVGRLHTDLDAGATNIKYILSGEGAGTIFVINEFTGDIHAMKRLDREEKSEYTLTAQVINRETNSSMEPPSEFIIKVQDINDNAPVFTHEPYHATVPEMSSVGTSVMKLTATDEDDPVYGNSARLVYSILKGQPYFSIEPHTGIIRTALPNMDREAREEYQVVIQAKDMGGHMGGLSGTTTVTITLTDVNDNPPKFTQSKCHRLAITPPLCISERDCFFYADAPKCSAGFWGVGGGGGENGLLAPHCERSNLYPAGTLIGFPTSLACRYSIDRHSDLDRLFNVNPEDGRIMLGKSLDREIDAWHNISVIATETRNLSQTSRSLVAIRVLDVNDNPPEFVSLYDAYLCENGKTGQVIKTINATDKDDPRNGHFFFYSLLVDMPPNPNFTIRNNEDNSVSILTRHSGFSRHKQDVYLLPIVISDNGRPPLSSTSTLTIQVCGCSSNGSVQSCNVEAFILPIGLSMGALIAILACIILLLVIVVLFVTLRRHKNEPFTIKDDEDVRENIIRYDDEGGGEEDTEAFDIATLQNPDGFNGFLPRRDIKPELQYAPRQALTPVPSGVDVDEFIKVRLHDADIDPTAPPYDSIQIYGYEGRGSVAGSLSSLDTASTDSEQNYDYLKDWGSRFKKLGDMYAVGESDRET